MTQAIQTDYGLILKNWASKYNLDDPRRQHYIHASWKAVGKAMRSPAWEIGSWYV